MSTESTETQVDEQVKSSKLQRIKSTALTAGVIMTPVALTAGSMLFNSKLAKMQLETARLNLDTAKLNHPSA